MGARKASKHQVTRAAWRNIPPTLGRRPAREQILDTRGQAQDGDARNVINARRTGTT
jgi:hypothetical protein